MPTYDKLTELSDAQDITGNEYSDKSYDLQVLRRFYPAGKQLFINFHIIDAFAGGTSLTLIVITSENENLSSHVDEGGSRVFLQEELPAGTHFSIPLMKLDATDRQYVGWRCVDVGAFTDGSITSYITETPISPVD